MFGDYQDFGGRRVLGNCGSFGRNYSGGNQCGRIHCSGWRGCFSGDSYWRSDLGGSSGSNGETGQDEKIPGSAVGRSPSRCSGDLDGLGENNGGNSGGKSEGHSGESNGGTRAYGDGKTCSRHHQDKKYENNYMDLGAHSGGGNLGGHLGRRGNSCDIGEGRTQKVHISESLQQPVQVDIDPEIKRVQIGETEEIKTLKRKCDSCINKVGDLQLYIIYNNILIYALT